MNAKTGFAIACCTLALLAGPFARTAQAGPLPVTGSTQSEPDWAGTIEAVNTADNSIIVNDRVFLLQAGTAYHGNRASRANLRAGMPVRIKSAPGSNGVPVAMEIWFQ